MTLWGLSVLLSEKVAMELHQLRYFVQVAKLESISGAAERLHVSQPALSKSIAKLEDELDTQLFDRVGKRIYLNNRGRLFLEGVEKSLHDLSDAQTLLGGTDGDVGGSIAVGVFGPQTDALNCTARFMRGNPKVRVTFDARQRTSSAHVTRTFDMVFFPADASFAGIAGISYARNTTRICVPQAHPLADVSRVSLARFRDDPFIFMNTTAGIYERSYQMCIDSGFSPWVRAVTTSGAAQMKFIQDGLGVGFVDTSRVNAGRGSTCILELELASSETDLRFACRPVRMLSATARAYLDFVLRYFGVPATEDTYATFDAN